MTYFAPALAATGSARFQSRGTEIGLARDGSAGAVLPLDSSLTDDGVRRPLVLGTLAWAVVAARGRRRSRLDGGRSLPAGMNRPDRRPARAAAARGTN